MLYPLLQKTEKNAPLLTASKTTPSHSAVVQVYMYITVLFIVTLLCHATFYHVTRHSESYAVKFHVLVDSTALVSSLEFWMTLY